MEEDFDIRQEQAAKGEKDFENALRPLRFGDFSGQQKVVENLDPCSTSPATLPASLRRSSRVTCSSLTRFTAFRPWWRNTSIRRWRTIALTS